VNGRPIEVWTDGACIGNPGHGGWAAVVRNGALHNELAGSAERTTNNRMELTAAIEGLNSLPVHRLVCVVTDSTYLRDGASRYISRWRRNGWRTTKGRPVKNRDLWEQLAAAMARQRHVRFRLVRGHSGHALNERTDQLATAVASRDRRSRAAA
jgi:ribonuclease HI